VCGHNGHWPKIGDAVPPPPFFWGGELGLHLTQRGRDPSYTSVPSFILIHPTVWSQYTNVTDKTGQTTVR